MEGAQLVLVILLLIYGYMLSSFVGRLYVDKKRDNSLNIKTMGLRDWDKKGLYNRTESTPYLALEDFVREYKKTNDGDFVDFGAGRARVTIFFNKMLKVNITGVELNDLTYEEALNNVKSYKEEYNNGVKVNIVKEYAEEYEITKKQKRFYFFNPFSVEIFAKVVKNIKNKANKYKEDAEIILYYPLIDYQDLLIKEGFQACQEIKPRNAISPKEKFIIYKYIGY